MLSIPTKVFDKTTSRRSNSIYSIYSIYSIQPVHTRPSMFIRAKRTRRVIHQSSEQERAIGKVVGGVVARLDGSGGGKTERTGQLYTRWNVYDGLRKGGEGGGRRLASLAAVVFRGMLGGRFPRGLCYRLGRMTSPRYQILNLLAPAAYPRQGIQTFPPTRPRALPSSSAHRRLATAVCHQNLRLVGLLPRLDLSLRFSAMLRPLLRLAVNETRRSTVNNDSFPSSHQIDSLGLSPTAHGRFLVAVTAKSLRSRLLFSRFSSIYGKSK